MIIGSNIINAVVSLVLRRSTAEEFALTSIKHEFRSSFRKLFSGLLTLMMLRSTNLIERYESNIIRG